MLSVLSLPWLFLSRSAFADPTPGGGAIDPTPTAEVGMNLAGDITGHFPPETVALFSVIFVVSLFIDLVQHRDHKDISLANAAIWSVAWIGLSLGFYGWLVWHHGADHPDWGSLFLTGYVLEKTLSVDNLMVFIAIFRFFNIKSGLQHRILYYGILGAIVFRALFVGVGTGLLLWLGPWAEIIFGLFVAWAGIQMLRGGGDDEEEPDYESMGLVRFFKRFFPVFPRLVGDKFFINRQQAEEVAAKDPTIKLAPGVTRWMTPAFVCLLVIEGSDVLFAVDSVPAVIAVSKEPLIVYTSMIFAVLGLRSLYFVVEVLSRYLAHLEKAVIIVLFFIAAKMFANAAHHFGIHLPWWSELDPSVQANYSMYAVLGILAVGVVASFIFPGKEEDDHKDDKSHPGSSSADAP